MVMSLSPGHGIQSVIVRVFVFIVTVMLGDCSPRSLRLVVTVSLLKINDIIFTPLFYAFLSVPCQTKSNK